MISKGEKEGRESWRRERKRGVEERGEGGRRVISKGEKEGGRVGEGRERGELKRGEKEGEE